MKHAISTFLMLTAASITFAQSNPEAPSFMQLDADSDGRISKEEALADARVAERFDEADSDSDGYLSLSEFSLLQR